MGRCGSYGIGFVHNCPIEGDRTWIRHASTEEVRELIGMGELRPGTTEAELSVYGCNNHCVEAGLAEREMVPAENPEDEPIEVFTPTEKSTMTHDSTCRAPDVDNPGVCSVCAA